MRTRPPRRAAVLVLGAVIAASLSTGAGSPGAAAPPASAWDRAAAIVRRMTLEQKLMEVAGTPDSSGFRHVDGIPSLGIPALYITNGPAGVGAGDTAVTPATAMPAPIALAATFSEADAHAYGDVVGAELRDVGRNLIEGPDVNMGRVPQNGRNFETYGEDPYLTSRMAVGWIEGVQGHGVLAEVKHFILNDQEASRNTVDANADMRTIREIYLPPFEAATEEAHVAAVMCSYNRVDGAAPCTNRELITTTLKQGFGWPGFVQSDFYATGPSTAVALADGGLDLEMPKPIAFGAPLAAAVAAHQVPVSVIDEMLTRRFAAMITAGLFDSPVSPTNAVPVPARPDGAIARSIAEDAIVLLKNASATLPLATSAIHRIAVVGPAAASATTGGGGTSAVVPLYSVSTLDGIRARAGASGTVTSDDGTDLARAVTDAQAADVAIVVAGDTEGEGADRPSLELPGTADRLIAAVSAANPHTVVVLKTGGPVLMPWIDHVAAVVEAWYPGEEDGDAVAAVLFGDVDPAGRLPETFPVSAGDEAATTPAQYPGTGSPPEETYSEGLDIGYRHFDAAGIQPLFPFGYGLSYTTFRYATLRAAPPTTAPAVVTFDVENTGRVAGDEVAQVYTGWPSGAAVSEPPRQLAAMARVSLRPGQTTQVTVSLRARAFSYWDDSSGQWKVQPGCFPVYVGASSRDVRLEGIIAVGGQRCANATPPPSPAAASLTRPGGPPAAALAGLLALLVAVALGVTLAVVAPRRR